MAHMVAVSGHSRGRTAPNFALILLAALFSFPPSQAGAIINPHYDEDSCGSCHLESPEEAPDGTMDYNFLGEDIDPTCLICHEKDCCTIAARHQFTHPSGTDEWDREKYGLPETLPLTNGYMTCATCHFWRRANNPKPRDYRLLRLVDLSDKKVDWTSLCSDCHLDYY